MPPDRVRLERPEQEPQCCVDEVGITVAVRLVSTLQEVEHREHWREESVGEEIVAAESLLVGRRELRLLVERSVVAARCERSLDVLSDFTVQRDRLTRDCARKALALSRSCRPRPRGLR